MPVPVCLTLVAARELMRALALPLHALLYLPRSDAWKRRSVELLGRRVSTGGHDALARFLERCPRPNSSGSTPHVFLSAGEASGEAHAVGLMRAVARGGLRPRWSCYGGPGMEQEGGELLFPLSEQAIMGLSGVLRAFPFIVRALAHFLRLLRTDPPDLVVLVDYPGLHVIMGQLARRHGVPVLHYIAPQYWGWAPWRLKRYRRCVDANLTILPFEVPFYESAGVPSEYVGHPLLDHLEAHPPEPGAVEAVRARPTVCLLPGSRRSELEANVAAYVALARRLQRDHPDLRFVLPQVDDRRAELIRTLLAAENADLIEFHIGPLAAWLRGSRVVLAKSGTGSLEACLQGTPTVVIYKVKGWLAIWFARTYVTVPHIAAANLIAGKQIVPEVVFDDDDGWLRAEHELRQLMVDGEQRQTCLDELQKMRDRMGDPGASDRAAHWVLEFFRQAGNQYGV